MNKTEDSQRSKVVRVGLDFNSIILGRSQGLFVCLGKIGKLGQGNQVWQIAAIKWYNQFSH